MFYESIVKWLLYKSILILFISSADLGDDLGISSNMYPMTM